MNIAPKYNNKQTYYVFKDIKKFLSEKFLYYNDIDSINILLNIYNIEESIENIFPRYLTLDNLRKDIIKLHRKKDGIELIAKNLSALLHDDINRFELFLYLEGYRLGFRSSKYANQLEIITLRYLTLDELYTRKKLFNYEFKNKEILSFKKHIFSELRKDQNIRYYLKEIIRGMDKNLLRNKINNLNKHLDLQLVFTQEDSDIKFKVMNSYLTKIEIETFNKKIIKFLYADGYRVFRNAFWDGINDKVMMRYK
ncbi:MAG: hypothetical protein Q4P25_04720 [Tissierellia bacterium]|nr:hypothetical protein [Tissierellia bacterium]